MEESIRSLALCEIVRPADGATTNRSIEKKKSEKGGRRRKKNADRLDSRMAVHTEQRKRESCESVASSIPTPHTWIHIIVFPGPAETKISKAYLFYIIFNARDISDYCCCSKMCRVEPIPSAD